MKELISKRAKIASVSETTPGKLLKKSRVAQESPTVEAETIPGDIGDGGQEPFPSVKRPLLFEAGMLWGILFGNGCKYAVVRAH